MLDGSGDRAIGLESGLSAAYAFSVAPHPGGPVSPTVPPTTEDRVLSPEDVERLRRREREGRDAGAQHYLEAIGSRGAFRLRAEDLTLIRHIAPRPHHRVLDAGSGVGRHALRLAPRVASLVALDFSAETLRVLAEEAARRGLRNLETRTGDVCDLPADLGGFDTVYCSEVLQHVPTHALRLAALGGFRRVLRPGGRCVVNVLCWNRRVKGDKDGFWDANGAYRHYATPAEVRGWFDEAGFRRVSLHGLLIAPGSITRRLPASLAFMEARLSTIPMLAGAGRFVIGVGQA
jgi:SAM-dependent methyltransferase